MSGNLIPDSYNINVHIDDQSILEIGVVIYLAIVAYHLFRKK